MEWFGTRFSYTLLGARVKSNMLAESQPSASGRRFGGSQTDWRKVNHILTKHHVDTTSNQSLDV
jgi:hypothetical protein